MSDHLLYERAGLFQDVLEHPEDDTPRLILADWLSEHGRTPAESDLAEFIRADHALLTAGYGCAREQGALTSRLHELHARHWQGWLALSRPDTAILPVRDSAGDPANWRLGFLSRLRLRLREFVAQAAVHFHCHPVREVVLTDRDPARPYVLDPLAADEDVPALRAEWVRSVGGLSPRNTLPPELFGRLAGGVVYGKGAAWCKHDRRRYGSTAEAALDLNRACLAHGRAAGRRLREGLARAGAGTDSPVGQPG